MNQESATVFSTDDFFPVLLVAPPFVSLSTSSVASVAVEGGCSSEIEL